MKNLLNLTEPERLHIARRRAGLTVEQMADRVGLSARTVTRIEHGDSMIGGLQADAWAHATGISTAVLLDQTYDEPVPFVPASEVSA